MNFPRSQDDTAIAQAIIAMARSLDITVIAEGVETAKQLAFLRAHRCDAVQGYYFSRPVTAGAMLQMLGKHLADQAGRRVPAAHRRNLREGKEKK